VTQQTEVANAVRAYRRHAGRYDTSHGEIFNDWEQDRLRRALERGIAAVQSRGNSALDYGCGTGNLTRHLRALDHNVTAADLSPVFVQMVGARFGVDTLILADGTPETVPDDSFDFIGLYSVMHHIPDYLDVVMQLVRKLKRGGVLFLDHEHNANHWSPDAALRSFKRDLADTPSGRWWDPEHRRWQYLARAALSPGRHLYRYRRMRNPRYSHEGDIHIWPDDHIDFDRIEGCITATGGEVVERFDYLLFKEGYDTTVWERHRRRTTDTGGVIARRF
jgi:SAM-dependent methyltransferase